MGTYKIYSNCFRLPWGDDGKLIFFHVEIL